MGWVKTEEKSSGEKSGEKTEVQSRRDVSWGSLIMVITGGSQGWEQAATTEALRAGGFN